MSFTFDEVVSQPDVWCEALLRLESFSHRLPKHGERIAVVGCGTSFYVGQSYVRHREAAGLGPGDVFTPDELPAARAYDRLVFITRSGTTSEVVRLVEHQKVAPSTVAITAVESSPAALAADQRIVLDFADERSVVQTRFATTVLALLRAHTGEDLGNVIDEASKALAGPLPADLSSFERFVFLGRGWAASVAHEAALKLRESALAWSESYSDLEFRHGPISVADAGTLVWALGNVDGPTLAAIKATGATVIDARSDPLVELVRIHRAALALADARGLDIDRPRHLSRSVVF